MATTLKITKYLRLGVVKDTGKTKTIFISDLAF